MKPDKLQLTLCSGLPYKLKGLYVKEQCFTEGELIHQYIGRSRHGWLMMASSGIDMMYTGGSHKPILRSMDDLTKPITQDGEEFIPIAALGLYLYQKEPDSFDDVTSAVYWLSNNQNAMVGWMLDLLDQWHFNRRGLDPDQYIDVKDLKENCY